ncbi:MAG: metal-dependent hydrolase [Candidatus Gastranaerophilales bacterium]|nr:metal-dependent hydrolase [Candidatus Gastranaerophilales bacterium]
MADGIKYLGHSAFYIKSGEYGILIDPWFLHNPNVTFDINREKITHIILTHGHSDHFGDTVNIAKATNAKVIAIFETAIFCQKMGLNSVGVGMGSAIPTDFGSVRFLPATHTNSLPNGEYGGLAASVLLDVDGVKIFHAGDTGLTREFELIGKLYRPYYAMLPIGGHYTMGVEEAIIAAEMLNAEEYIPMHYNTFDVIAADPIEFKTALEEMGKTCHIMPANEVLTF